MRIDIIEVKTKNNKIIVIVILAILFIIFSSLIGIHYAKLYNAKLIAQNKLKNLNSSSEIMNNVIKHNKTSNNIIVTDKPSDVGLSEKINNIYNKESKIAYLTFDDGPSQAVTPLILDVLKEENIKATFFVLGTNVKKNPEIVKRAYEEGHYIANHGYTHNYSKIYENPKKVLDEYNKGEKQIRNAIKVSTYSSNLFRFPGGFEGRKICKSKKRSS